MPEGSLPKGIIKKKSDVTRIFWPEHCNSRDGGQLVGWNMCSFTACVATVVKGVQLRQLSNALEVLATCPRYAHLFAESGGPPCLLGEYKNHSKGRHISHAVQQIRQTANFWLTLDAQNGYPSLRDIHCCGFRYSVFSVTAQFIIYTQPSGMSYYSTEPFTLHPQPRDLVAHPSSEFETGLKQANSSSLVENVLHEVLARMLSSSSPRRMVWEGEVHEPPLLLGGWSATALREESSSDCDEASPAVPIPLEHRTIPNSPPRMRPSSPSKPSSLHWVGRAFSSGYVSMCVLATHLVLVFLILIHTSALALSWVLETRVLRLAPLLGAPIPQGREGQERWRALRIATAVGRQLQRRLDQMSSSPIFSPSSWADLQYGAANAQSRAVTVKFNTSVCMVGLDLFLGLIGCSCALNNTRLILQAVDEASLLHTRLLLQAVRWIMGVPAGLKLNDSLDYCLGNLCILGIQCYQVTFLLVRPLFPWFLLGVAVSGVFGATIMMSVISDLLSLATMHIYTFYALAARWHGLQTRALSSLWLLFRGKKRNVLRGRIDSCDYSLDQLLLGTMLFTLLVFLFPTTFVYYLLFFLIYTTIGLVQSALAIFIWVINHFPLFSVVNCLWDPAHLPGGVCLELLATGDASAKAPSCESQLYGGGTAFANLPLAGANHDALSSSGQLRHSISLPDMSMPLSSLSSHPSLSSMSSFSTASAVHPYQRTAPTSDGPTTGAGASSSNSSGAGGGNFAGSSQPSPLRANERRKASLWGRSSYYRLKNRPLAIPSLFDHYRNRLAKITAQQSPIRLLRCMLLAEALPGYVLGEEASPKLLPLLDLWLFFKLNLFGLTANE